MLHAVELRLHAFFKPGAPHSEEQLLDCVRAAADDAWERMGPCVDLFEAVVVPSDGKDLGAIDSDEHGDKGNAVARDEAAAAAAEAAAAAACFSRGALLAGALLQRGPSSTPTIELVLTHAVRLLGTPIGWLEPAWERWPRLISVANVLAVLADAIPEANAPSSPRVQHLWAVLDWAMDVVDTEAGFGTPDVALQRALLRAADERRRADDVAGAIFLESQIAFVNDAAEYFRDGNATEGLAAWLPTEERVSEEGEIEGAQRNLARSRAWLAALRVADGFDRPLRLGGWHAELYQRCIALHLSAASALAHAASAEHDPVAAIMSHASRWELAEAVRRGALANEAQSGYYNNLAMGAVVTMGRAPTRHCGPQPWFDGIEHPAIALVRSELSAHSATIRSHLDALYRRSPGHCQRGYTELNLVRSSRASQQAAPTAEEPPALRWQRCGLGHCGQWEWPELANEDANADEVVALLHRVHAVVPLTAARYLRLVGGTTVRWHTGYDSHHIRHLLTLRDGCAPQPSRPAGEACAHMSVGFTDPARGFIEGDVLSFDDSFWHTVVSRGPADRFREVFLLETLNPLQRCERGECAPVRSNAEGTGSCVL